MRRVSVRSLFAASSAFALMQAAPALAQAVAPPAAAPVTAPSPPPAQTAEGPNAVTEVVVTAQKRSENVQKVPVAVSVVSAQTLANNAIFNAENLDEIVPSVTFKKGSTNANSTLSIRGIGTQSFASGAEPSVSTVVDGVVYGRSGMAFQEFTDVDHIEVLRGPQGTLFGKNANAGVINIVSKTPTQDLHGDASVGYFEGGEERVNLDLSGPITDRIGFTLSALYGDYRGNVFNTYDDKWTNGYQRYGIHGKIVAEITDDLKFTLNADYTHANDSCCADVLGNYVPSAQLTNVFLPSISPVAARYESKEVDNNLTPQTKDSNGGVSGQFDYRFGGGYTLTSITAWREWRNKQQRDGDFHGSYGDYVATAGAGRTAASMDLLQHDDGALNYNQYSQEIRLASPTNQRFRYVVGGFLWYTDETDWFRRSDDECTASTLAVAANGFQPCAVGSSTYLSISGPANWETKFYNEATFGEATFDITSRLHLIGGARYTFDRVSYRLARNYSATPPTGISVPGVSAPVSLSGATDDSGPSGKVGLQYDFTPHVMGYATYSRGYKGPAFNVFYNETANNAAPIAPETSDSYEIGLKSEWFNRKLTLNVAAFDERFYNFQANSFILVNGSVATSLTNAGNVRSEGVELEATWRPTHDLTFSGGYTYDDAIIVAYRCNAATLTAANYATCIGHDGKQLPFAPQHKADVTANWRLPLDGIAPFDADATVTDSYTSLTNFDIDQTPLARQPAYNLVDASLTLSTKDGHYHLSFIAKNLTNQYYTTFITPSGTGIAAGSYTRLQIPRDAQRYVGVVAKASF